MDCRIPVRWYLLSILTLFMSSFSKSMMIERIPEGFENNSVKHIVTGIMAAIGIIIIVPVALIEAMFINKLNIHSWDQLHMSHGRTEVWVTLLKVSSSVVVVSVDACTLVCMD
jgi:hypothetical protein